VQGSPELAEAVLKLVKDPDPAVRLQLAYGLGEWEDERAAHALGEIALRDAKDPYLSAAVMSSVNAKNLPAVLASVTGNPKRAPAPALLSNLLRMAAAFGNGPALVAAVEAVARPAAGASGGRRDDVRQFTAVAGALDGLEQAGVSLAELSKRSPALSEAVAKLAATFDAAREAAIDETADPKVRAAAAGLLGRGAAADEREFDADILAGLLTPQTPEPVQSAAIAGLARLGDPAASGALLKAWQGMTPALRLQTLDAILQRRKLIPQLLDAMEKRTVLAADLDAARRRQLLQHADEAVRARARKAFAGAVNPDRQKVIDEFKPALTLAGDVARGREFFKAACATCHKVGDLGVNVGPDLMSLNDRSPDYHLLHVLDPNRAVEARYTNYVVETKAGRMFAGVLTGETGNSVTLMGPGGTPQTVLRSDVKRLRATPLSAMPEGLEIGRTPQDFADLFAFVNQGKAQQQQPGTTGKGTQP
jgi:putative heme-binding domain-containing protein